MLNLKNKKTLSESDISKAMAAQADDEKLQEVFNNLYGILSAIAQYDINPKGFTELKEPSSVLIAGWEKVIAQAKTTVKSMDTVKDTVFHVLPKNASAPTANLPKFSGATISLLKQCEVCAATMSKLLVAFIQDKATQSFFYDKNLKGSNQSAVILGTQTTVSHWHNLIEAIGEFAEAIFNIYAKSGFGQTLNGSSPDELTGALEVSGIATADANKLKTGFSTVISDLQHTVGQLLTLKKEKDEQLANLQKLGPRGQTATKITGSTATRHDTKFNLEEMRKKLDARVKNRARVLHRASKLGLL